MAATMTLRKTDIPEYLKQGELYRNLMENNDDPNEEVTFPINVLKMNVNVYDVVDCDLLLNSLRFWAVDGYVSKELICFALLSCSDLESIVEVFQKYEAEFRFVHWLHQITVANIFSKARIAIQSGIVELVQPLAELGRFLPIDACDVAAEEGNLEVFQCLYRHGCVWNVKTGQVAALRGHTPILKFMIANGYTVGPNDFLAAIRGGSVECVKLDNFAHSLRFFTLQYFPCDEAARAGHLETLIYLHGASYRWDRSTISAAATSGHLHILKYLHEQGCPWDRNATTFAAHTGHLHCLRYLHENGCAWDVNATTNAARYGHLHCLQYLHEQGCAWDTTTTSAAVQRGHLPCLQYLHEHNCPWTAGNICELAARAGHAHCLKYLHENGCAMNADFICEMATRAGHVACVQYAHEHGAKLASAVFSIAAEGGSTLCLQYFHKQGVWWNCLYGINDKILCSLYYKDYNIGKVHIHPTNHCYEYLIKNARNC